MNKNRIFVVDHFLDVRQVTRISQFVDNNAPMTLRKGGAKDPEHEVDGISGGTKTSDGVTAMLRDCLSAYLPYFESQYQAAAQSAPAAANEAASSEVSNQQNVNESHE